MSAIWINENGGLNGWIVAATVIAIAGILALLPMVWGDFKRWRNRRE